MSRTKGLHFHRFDLHVHTPASRDYRGGPVTAKQIVDAAIAAGLSAIAITDHQTAANVDAIIEAAKGTTLTVFPGVELMTAGGKHGIHINLIFDVDKTATHIQQFLNTVGVYVNANGQSDVLTEYTVGRVADDLWKYDRTAIITLAHCHSSKGVSGDIQGEQRSQIFDPRRRNILGAEAKEANFLDEQKRKDKTRVFDIFSGTDDNYGRFRLGVFQASDAHALNEIGTSYSWFKVDDEITIEDLRQCLADRDTRIRQPHEHSPEAYPHVTSLTITSGFLKGQTLPFHPGLNSLLGAKGSGKSLAIEALRFALRQPPTIDEIVQDHESKLQKCIGPYGEVKVGLSDGSGKSYEVTRTFLPSDGNPTRVVDLADGSEKDFAVEEIFSVLFLSQNEIVRVAEDRTGRSLRSFIDRFFDFRSFEHRIEQAKIALAAADRKVAESLRARLGLMELRSKAATMREEVARLDRQLADPTFAEYTKGERVGRQISVQSEFVAGLRAEVGDLAKDFLQRSVPKPEADADPGVRRSHAAAVAALAAVNAALTDLEASLAQPAAEVEAEHAQWSAQFAPAKKQYEEFVAAAGGNKGALDQRRRKLVAELVALELQEADLRAKADGLKEGATRRADCVTALDTARRAYFDERTRRCSHFTDHSKGAIEVTLAEGLDVSAFRAKLLAAKRGSYLKDTEIDKLSIAVSPKELVAAALKFEASERKEFKHADELAQSKGLPGALLRDLIAHLLSTMTYEQLMSLLHEDVPQDLPQVRYRVGGQLKPLADLSVGQKASALLIMALSDGRFPIVIDQPEDSLDLRTIWDDVCLTLRDTKERRQFIFTTHNSSVAVASDSDVFTVLEADAVQATVVYSGSINTVPVRNAVVTYLEGGPDTYDRKAAKYNLLQRLK